MAEARRVAAASPPVPGRPTPPEPPPHPASAARSQPVSSSTARALCESASAAYSAGDASRASKLWLRAATEHRDLTGVFHVALCCADGIGHLPRDPAKAASLLAPLADQRVNHGWSQFVLASLIIRKHVEAATGARIAGLAPDASVLPQAERRAHPELAKARSLLESAAHSGTVPPAWLALSHACALGVGARPDELAAARWLRHAADRGDPFAADALAPRLFRGGSPGVDADPAEAVAMWRIAAEAGRSPFAMHNLGVAYLHGSPPATGAGASGDRSVPVDLAAARVWFERAAEAGLVRSMVNAGRLRELGGPGVGAPDAAAALAWYRRAEARLAAAQAEGGTDAKRSRALLVALADVRQRIAALGFGAGTGGRTTPAVDAATPADGGYAMALEFDSPAARDEALRELQTAGSGASSLSLGSVLDAVRAWQGEGSGAGLASLRVTEPLARRLERAGGEAAAPAGAELGTGAGSAGAPASETVKGGKPD